MFSFLTVVVSLCGSAYEFIKLFINFVILKKNGVKSMDQNKNENAKKDQNKNENAKKDQHSKR